MSDQNPGAGSRPTPDPGTGVQKGPAPVTTPPAGQPAAAGQPDVGAAPGWGAPAASTNHAPDPAWAMPGHESTPPAAAGWGAPAAPGWGAPSGTAPRISADKPWTLKRGLAVAGAAVVLAAGAGVGVYALTSSSAAASNTAAGAAGGPGGSQGSVPGMPGAQQGGFDDGGLSGPGGHDDFDAGGVGGMAGGLSSAVHAEYVVLNGSEYTTTAEQLGTVSEVSSSSVTVKSSDGFTRSYALGSDVVVSHAQQRRQQAGGTGTQLSVADIVAGGTVRVVAAKAGAGYTASSVQIVAATGTGQTN
ncbi:hypothetical protein [uncultured Arthrobacter sp.]|uniref:hypothetical protein n=1 Tax=uncultured Arthrobacter sp. TaxID=114050 RepID=UPI003216B90B